MTEHWKKIWCSNSGENTLRQTYYVLVASFTLNIQISDWLKSGQRPKCSLLHFKVISRLLSDQTSIHIIIWSNKSIVETSVIANKLCPPLILFILFKMYKWYIYFSYFLFSSFKIKYTCILGYLSTSAKECPPPTQFGGNDCLGEQLSRITSFPSIICLGNF